MKEIRLPEGQVALVDDEDYPVLSLVKWHIRRRGTKQYAICHPHLNSNPIQMHSFLLYCPPHMHTDHIDGNGLNNQRVNLRIVTNQQNQWNRGRNRNCQSRYKGVHWHSGRGKWQVDCGGKYFGLYSDEKEAALVYNEKARELYGIYAKLNEVQDE